MRILLIEDDPSMASAIQMMLKSDGYVVEHTDTGEDGLDIAKLYELDAILLDINLPDISGHEVIRRLRLAKVGTPVLMLTGQTDINDKVRSLSNGADDYVTKPFHAAELRARLQAIIRRGQGHASNVIHVGALTVHIDEQTARVNGEPLKLSNKEYAILELLCLRQGQVISKEGFLNHLYSGMDEPEMKIIDVFICKLRKKLVDALGHDLITTSWGRGYTIDPQSANRAPDARPARPPAPAAD